MSRDPYSGSYDFSNPQSLNRYSYAMNNPLTFTDPSGLDPPCTPDNDGVYCLEGTPGIAFNIYDYFPNYWRTSFIVPSAFPTGPDLPTASSFISRSRPGTPWYKTCSAKVIGSGLLHVGIDAIGLIPEAEGFTKVFENEAGYQLARAVGNSAGYSGVVATQYGMKVVAQGKGAAAAIGGAFGLGDTSAQGRISTGLTVAGFILGVGTAAAAGSIGVDAYKTAKAVWQCP
ncbi:MAG TPA: hypothetical protein VHX11_13075 [Acidobacteriaceae bacterium]|jgi:hypothetical protein|nr:hypothetical protein [Acidobacteriaceae bacterium]